MAIYASETWKSNNNLAHKLDAFHHRCLWKLLKISWRDHVTNDAVRQRSGQRKLSEIVKERHLKLLGHIQNMPEERLPKHHWSGHLLEVKEKGADQSHLEKNNTARLTRHGDKLGRVQDYSC